MITVNGITKIFRLYQRPSDRLKEIVLRRPFHKEYTALDAVSLHVAQGSTLGIIGENGSGKSTLLKILTGVLLPDGGTFRVDGKIAGLLELGTGFNPEFSGIQNIYLNATYLGLGREEIRARLEDIIGFAELGEFIHEPLKTYSSGMVMRLAFATAIHADPQCFVVDEALAVGDAHFQQKCMQKLRSFREAGGSIVFVSHDMNAVKVLCDDAILLDHGRVVHTGDPDAVINQYNYLLAAKQGEDVRGPTETESMYGNQKVQITEISFTNSRGDEAEVFISGESCRIDIGLQSNADVGDVTVGIVFRDRFGQDIFGINTFHLRQQVHLEKDSQGWVRYRFEALNLGPGKYTMSVAVHSEDVHVHDCYQWIDGARSFEVVSGTDFFFTGLARLTPSVSFEVGEGR